MFKNMRVGTRLGLMSGLLVILTLVVAYIGYSRIVMVYSEWQQYQKVELEKQNDVYEGSVAFGNAIHMFKDYVLRGRDYDKKFAVSMDSVDAKIAAYRTAGDITAEEEMNLKNLSGHLKDYRGSMAELVAARTANSKIGIGDLDNSVAGKDKPVSADLNDLLKIIGKAENAQQADVETIIQETEKWIVVVSIIVVLLSGPLAFWITRSITKPLGVAVGVADQLSEGDLTMKINVTSTDETGMLLGAMQNMIGRLSQIITEVRVIYNLLHSMFVLSVNPRE